MKNKVLVELVVPDIEKKYDVFIPVSKKIGNVIVLLNKAIADLNNGLYQGSNLTSLYNKNTSQRYAVDELVRNTDIRNGTTLILL